MVALLATAISLLACISTGYIQPVTGANAVAPPPLEDVPIVVQNQTEKENVTFVYMYVKRDGSYSKFPPTERSVHVVRTNKVSQKALLKATKVVSQMVRNMPWDVFNLLTYSLGIGLFTRSEGVSVYPENNDFVDRPECHDRCDGHCSTTCTYEKQKYSQMFGLTGLRAVVLDDNVLCNAQDPYNHTSNILTHELALLIMYFMPIGWRKQIISSYNVADSGQLWNMTAFGRRADEEYWAVASQAFFHDTLRKDVSGGMNMCGTADVCPNEMAARSYIQRHDPDMFEVLSYVYTNNNPTKPGNIRVCR